MDLWSHKGRTRKHGLFWMCLHARGSWEFFQGWARLSLFWCALKCHVKWHFYAHFLLLSNVMFQGHLFWWLKSCITKKVLVREPNWPRHCSPTVGSFAGSLAWGHQNLGAHQRAWWPCCCPSSSLTPLSAVSPSCLEHAAFEPSYPSTFFPSSIWVWHQKRQHELPRHSLF